MNRRHWILGSLGAVSTGLLVGKSLMEKESMTTTTKMPVVFFGHGSPMNAVEQNSFTDFLSGAGKLFPKPKAIMAVSAHWQTRGTRVLRVAKPETIHDFGGFPEALYKIQYPAPGSPEMADKTVELLHAHEAKADESWGLDHGTWTVLKYLYPAADIPVLQLSLNLSMTLKEHLALAKDLRALREQGVLILGSGNVTHNLWKVDFSGRSGPQDWALEFDQLVKTGLEKKDHELLTSPGEKASLWKMAHPSLDHYLPILYVLGASDESEQVKFIHESMQLSSLSMRSFMFG